MADLINRGWSNVESNPSAAKAAFKQALDIQGGNAAANYGYGYSTLRSGDAAGARPFLCLALKDRDVDTQREVQSLLDQNNLVCP